MKCPICGTSDDYDLPSHLVAYHFYWSHTKGGPAMCFCGEAVTAAHYASFVTAAMVHLRQHGARQHAEHWAPIIAMRRS